MQHEGAVRFPDFRHFIVEAGSRLSSAGFVILQGCRNPHHSIELKRLVLLPASCMARASAGPACAGWPRWRFATCMRTGSGST